MLDIQHIHKQYKTGDLVQNALDDVSLTLRDQEFVSILGPSGSGKTTLLNIIGGLDRYDSGDLIINGISTKKYSDKDWDSYRNHTIGFVFQSYNLIPHQSVLSNVELALTISGIRRRKRRQLAKEALEKVGLKEHMHKRPNQLSGGQMQRVAIARALVNNPDILLADEPTGALDSETSVQVMELLKEVAKDRLVVMVTHNPDLAYEYATRIIKLKDGKITDDSNPAQFVQKETVHKNLGKASMSFFTSLSLSFNNLRTKKARTLLTSFAGSIGIIGIALILALSSGVNTYISDTQKSTMTMYPIEIDSQTTDLSELMESRQTSESTTKKKKNTVYSDNTELEANVTTSNVTTNNLKKFKKYLEEEDNPIVENARKDGIVYSYDLKYDVYSYDSEGTLVNADGSTLDDDQDTSYSMMMSNSSIFEELMSSDGNINEAITDNYDVLYGKWAENYDEVVLVLDQNHQISTKTLYKLGILPTSEYKEYIEKSESGEKVELEDRTWTYEELCEQELYLLPTANTYILQENGTYQQTDQVETLFDQAIALKIVGVVALQEDSETNVLSSGVAYTHALTEYIMNQTNESAVVQAQQENKDTNVLNGLSFEVKTDEEKIEATKEYLSNLETSEKAEMMRTMSPSTETLSMSESDLATMLDAYLVDPDDATLLNLYNNYLDSGSYDENMSTFGVVDEDDPSSIAIYADSFEAKEAISDAIEDYNESVSEKNQITYTDYVGLLMSSVTTMVNVITYVLVAFVAVSLVVSSIMIGIITYISVLERTKEIGILRAMGASKKNISRIFNAETFIIGLVSGLMGIGISELLLIPGNKLIQMLTDSSDIHAQIPVTSAIVLIVLATILTMIGGWIPSKKAAKQDPVKALRTE